MNVHPITHEGSTSWVDPTLALPLLESVEEMPADVSGAFLLGEGRQVNGMVLVQKRTICWAVTNRMQGRLTDLLIEESSTSITRDEVEKLYRRCKGENRPLGQTLVDAGLVSAPELRDALCRHTCESLLTLIHAGSISGRWLEHDHADYSARFTFTPASLFVALGALQKPDIAQDADSYLRNTLLQGCPGVACIRDGGGTAVAALCTDGLTSRDIHELARWSPGAVDIASVISPRPKMVAMRDEYGGVVSWAHGEVLFTALCRDASEFGYVTSVRKRA